MPSDTFLEAEQRAEDELILSSIPILVVDDAQASRDVMKDLLVSKGYATVHLAASGEETSWTSEAVQFR